MTNKMPGGTGIGLRPPHYQDILASKPEIPWFEAISENYMFTEGRPIHILETIRKDYPVALHGVSLSIGSCRNGREGYLKALSDLICRIDPWIVSDHFCWTGLGGHNAFDLLPLPFHSQSMKTLVENIDHVQNRLKRRLYLENVSAYIGFEDSQLSEIEFINEVIWKSGCGLLLDVNNVYVNAHNFGFDAKAYIDRIDPECVGEIHLAGHSKVDDFLFDTHDGTVCEDVWHLFSYAVKHVGTVPVLIEWDESIPDLDTLIHEKATADKIIGSDTFEVGRYAE